MKLTTRQLEILDFCEEPKLAVEIAAYLDLNISSIYKYMTALTKSGLLKTMYAGSDQYGGTKLFFTAQDIEENFREISFPEFSLFNLDFIRVAHNPFNIGVQHG